MNFIHSADGHQSGSSAFFELWPFASGWLGLTFATGIFLFAEPLPAATPLFWGGGAATPVQVSSLSGAVAIAGGGSFSLALKCDGTVWAWGRGYEGQLGDGNFYTTGRQGVATPVQARGLTSVTAIAGGHFHSLAVKSDGTVWAWGYGVDGQLGDGNFYLGSATPVQVSGLTAVTAIAGGYLHSMALKSDGTVWAWGDGQEGQLGDGNFYISPPGVATPVQVGGLTAVRAIACGWGHSLALKSDGTVWAWGYGQYGQLGDGNFYTSGNKGVATPVQVTGLTGVAAIASRGQHSLALKTDGTVWAWGQGDFGQLGDGNFYTSGNKGVATPVQVSGLTGAVAIACGYVYSLALKSDGTVWGWGVGIGGQLGDGNFYPDFPFGVATPVLASNLGQPVSAIAAGVYSLALPAPAANKPFIVCPCDVKVYGSPCSAVVNYPAPLVSGGIGNVVVVCNPPSGAVFPTGATTVNCTATDEAGNIATCSFNVTVKESDPPKGSCAAVTPFKIFQNPLRKVGRFQLLASDNCDPDPKIYIGDSRSSFVAGPFHNLDLVEISAGPSLTPNQHEPDFPPGRVNVDFEAVTGSIGDHYLPGGVKFFQGNDSYGRSTDVLGSAESLFYPGVALSGAHVLVPNAAGDNNDIVVYFFDGAGNRTEADFAEVHNDLEAEPATITLAGFDRNGTLIISKTFTGVGIAGAITARHMWYVIVGSAPGTSGLLAVDDFSFALDGSTEVTVPAPNVAVVFTKGDPLVWAVDISGNASTPVKCK